MVQRRAPYREIPQAAAAVIATPGIVVSGSGPMSTTRLPLGGTGAGTIPTNEQNTLTARLVTQNVTSWSTLGAVLAGAVADPYGGTEGFTIQENAANSQHEAFAGAVAGTIAAGRRVSMSAVVKNVTGSRWLFFNLETAGVVDSFAYCNPSLGILGTLANTSGDVQVSLEPLGNGFFLFTMTRTLTSATAFDNAAIGLADVDGGFVYQGDNASKIEVYEVNVSVFDNDVVEAATLGVGVGVPHRVLALLRGSRITETQMPANTGDMVIYIAAAVTAPTVAPVGGFVLYVDPADSKLKAIGPGGTITTLAVP